MQESAHLTKSDFLNFLDSPMHLWAARHGQLKDTAPSSLQLRLMAQGQQVEKLAEAFMAHHLGDAMARSQVPLVDGPYEARADFMVYDAEAGAADMYEIKSSTSVKREHEYDLAFQALVSEAIHPVRNVYLVLVNKEYVRAGEIDPLQMFKVEDLTEKVIARKAEVLLLREEALAVVQQSTPENFLGCLAPRSCPCPDLCHPDLPQHSIFEIPRIGKKARELQTMGIQKIMDILDDFPLSEAQRAQLELVKAGSPVIDQTAIRRFLEGLVFPLYFLDYETVNPAVPLYDGYHPYDLVVFQYSLHVVDAPGAAAIRHEALVLDPVDPAGQIASTLAGLAVGGGSVIVWNKAFEKRCNDFLARQVPEFVDFFKDINSRLVDLMDVFKKGAYQHPDFRGSASLKSVLPVLIPDMKYEDLEIRDGEQAMQAWWELVFGDLENPARAKLEQDLKAYCTQDSEALVKIWRALMEMGR